MGRGWFRKDKQRTFVYCPICKFELAKGGRFMQDTEKGVEYMCGRCNCRSLWYFDDPVPWIISYQHLEKKLRTHHD